MKIHGMIALAALLFTGCAHDPSVDRKVENELAAEPPVSTGRQLAAESRDLINTSSELTPEQKERLLTLHTRMAGEARETREEEGRLKMVLFRTVLDPSSREAEITNLKTRILALDQKKTERMLSALSEVREILGRRPINDKPLLRALELSHFGEY